MTALAISSEAGALPRVQAEGGFLLGPSSVSLELPMPPSTNKIWRRTRTGMHKSPAYLDWQMEAGWRLRAQRPASIAGPVVIALACERDCLASADIDNRVKALFDLLVEHRVIQDDRHVVGFAAAWAPPANRLARIAVFPAGPMLAEFHLSPDRASGGWFMRPTTTEGL